MPNAPSSAQSNWHLETRLLHGAKLPAQLSAESQGAVLKSADKLGSPTLPPVVFSSGFTHQSPEDMEAVCAGQSQGYVYSRIQNPTVAALEQRFSEVCDAKGCIATASGMSAIACGLMTLLKQGDEILVSNKLFGGTHSLFADTLAELGIRPLWFDPDDIETARQAFSPQTKAVYLEAIANPLIAVPNFAHYRALCDEKGLVLLVDATMITPCALDLEALGADLLFFSATKFLAGAAGVTAGFIVDSGRCDWQAWQPKQYHHVADSQSAFLSRLRTKMMRDIGPNLAPLNAFMLWCGLETLPLRWEKQCKNAEKIAHFMAKHPLIGAVHHPSLPEHPHHQLCKTQFHGWFGSLLSIKLGSKKRCFQWLNQLKLIALVLNLGDTRTIAVHPASTIYSGYWPHQMEAMGISEDLVRISVGIEHHEDIMADIEQALEHL